MNRFFSFFATLLIRMYQSAMRPIVSPCCRFVPSCSEYSLQAFRKHGFFRGAVLTVQRLLRCHPFCRGGYDPIP